MRSPYGGRDHPSAKANFRAVGCEHKIVEALSVRRGGPPVFKNGFPHGSPNFCSDEGEHKIVGALSVRRRRPTVLKNGFPHGWSGAQNCGRALRTEKATNR